MCVYNKTSIKRNIQTKYSNHQTKYIGKKVRLRTYQHPCIIVFSNVQFVRHAAPLQPPLFRPVTILTSQYA